MANVQKISPDPTLTSEHTTSTAKISQLLEDGFHWILYREQFLAAVILKRLRCYLLGTERKPVPPTVPGVNSDADERYDNAYDW